jgi:hypothetical protein
MLISFVANRPTINLSTTRRLVRDVEAQVAPLGHRTGLAVGLLYSRIPTSCLWTMRGSHLEYKGYVVSAAAR